MESLFAPACAGSSGSPGASKYQKLVALRHPRGSPEGRRRVGCGTQDPPDRAFLLWLCPLTENTLEGVARDRNGADSPVLSGKFPKRPHGDCEGHL